MNHLFILTLFTLSGTLLGCGGRNFYTDNSNNQAQQQESASDTINRCVIFFEKEIIIKNNKDPYVYLLKLEDAFKRSDTNITHNQNNKTFFEELYLYCDSKAASFGLFIKNAMFTEGIAKNICTTIDPKFYLITDTVSKELTYVQGSIMRINGKNFCKTAFNTQMDEIELAESMTDKDIESYFKDLFNPFAHQEVFRETFNDSKQKIETLMFCFKWLDAQKKIKIPKVLVLNNVIPVIFTERFQNRFKKINSTFIDAIANHNKEQEMAYIKTPIYHKIQQFFLSGKSINSFNKNARRAFIDFSQNNKNNK